MLDAIGGGLGIWLTGVMYTNQGSYQLPFIIFSGLIVIALLAITQVRYPENNEGGTLASVGDIPC